jgi:hypothetical protein
MIETRASLVEYFREVVAGTMRELAVEASEMSEFYVVNLLAEFSVRSPETSEPLALRFKRALAAELEERIRLLKDLGDSSLYVSGFFGESLNRGAVDVDYYIAMGEQAYDRLARLVPARPSGGMFNQLYGELAEKFPSFVAVLTEIAEQSAVGAASSNQDLVGLYERWRRTGSARAAAKLRERGVLPGRGNGGGLH